MGERRHAVHDRVVVHEQEPPASAQAVYDALYALQQSELQRVHALHQLEQERDLTFDESTEMLVLHGRTESRDVRLEAALRAAQTAVRAETFQTLLDDWPALVDQKKAAWSAFVAKIGELRQALADVETVHSKQEIVRAQVVGVWPDHMEFPTWTDVARWVGGRMAPFATAWDALLTPHASAIPLQSPPLDAMMDADPGTKEINVAYLRRRNREAAQAGMPMPLPFLKEA